MPEFPELPPLTEAEQDQVVTLYDASAEPLRRFAASLPTRPQFSTDRELVMITFEEAIKNWRTMGAWARPRQFGWLRDVCRKQRVNEFRTQARLDTAIPHAVDWQSVPADDPLDVALGRIALEACERAMLAMPPRQREAAQMAWLLLMPRAQIAAVQGSTLAAIRVHLCNARKVLLEAVGPLLPFPLADVPFMTDDDDDEPERTGGRR